MTIIRNLGVHCGLLALLLAAMSTVPQVCAGTGRVARELTEELCERLGAKLTRTQADALLPRVESIVSKYGDEATMALRKSGLRAVDAIESAGSDGAQCIRLLARRGDEALWVVSRPKRLAIFVKHGDDAAAAMIKHGEVVERWIGRYGDDAAGALARVDGRNARRLAMLSEEGLFESVPSHSIRLFSVIKNGGDEAADFVWKNKGALTIASTLIAFVNDPEPFITGARELGSETIEHIVAPIAQRAATQFPWWSVWLLGLIGIVLLGVRLLPTMVTRRRTSIASPVPFTTDDSTGVDRSTTHKLQFVPSQPSGNARLKNVHQRIL